MQHIDKGIQLKPGEDVLEVVHEDIVPHLPRFFLLFLWVVIPFFFLFPLFRQGWVGVLIFAGLVGSATFFFARAYVKWSRTVLIVTDRRVIDVERKAYLDREISEISYPCVDEVSYRVKGVFPTLFRYGSIRLHVAGNAADIEFKNAARPSRIHDLINDLREHARSQKLTDESHA